MEIWLAAIYVDDGQWHTAKVRRYGSAAILTLDGGEGRRYNDSFIFKGHQVQMTDISTLQLLGVKCRLEQAIIIR